MITILRTATFGKSGQPTLQLPVTVYGTGRDCDKQGSAGVSGG